MPVPRDQSFALKNKEIEAETGQINLIKYII